MIDMVHTQKIVDEVKIWCLSELKSNGYKSKDCEVLVETSDYIVTVKAVHSPSGTSMVRAVTFDDTGYSISSKYIRR